MRPIVIVELDKARPALVLTRDLALGHLSKVTIVPITSTIRGLTTEVLLSSRNGLDHECVASCDNITTVAKRTIVRQVGFLFDDQEEDLARAVTSAFNLLGDRGGG